MNINYGLFFSFRNISDRNREEYDLTKHQGQNIWKGSRYRLIVGENKPRILTFSRRRQNRLNGVLGETGTVRTRVWASCAHASLRKFTSGSRRSLSRPRILRSLICVRDGRKKTVETWLSIRETKAESGSSKGGSRKGPNEGRRLIIIITTIHYLYSRLYTWL